MKDTQIKKKKMNKIKIKNLILNFMTLITIFLIDRISKIYILKLAELENSVDIYITPYLNLYLMNRITRLHQMWMPVITRPLTKN